MTCEDAHVRFVHVLLLSVVGCGGDDGSSTRTDAAVADARMADAPISMATSMTAVMVNTRMLDKGFYGINTADGTLHVEAHRGGVTTCPQMNSPTPDYSLIIGQVAPMSAPMGSSTANFLDYTGDMLPNNQIGAPAINVNLSNITYVPGTSVALDAEITFDAGTITGHLYAIYCNSLDG